MVVKPHSTKLPQSWDTGSDQPSVLALSFHFRNGKRLNPRTSMSIVQNFISSFCCTTCTASAICIILFQQEPSLDFPCLEQPDVWSVRTELSELSFRSAHELHRLQVFPALLSSQLKCLVFFARLIHSATQFDKPVWASVCVCLCLCVRVCFSQCMYVCMHACMHGWMDGWTYVGR